MLLDSADVHRANGTAVISRIRSWWEKLWWDRVVMRKEYRLTLTGQGGELIKYNQRAKTCRQKNSFLSREIYCRSFETFEKQDHLSFDYHQQLKASYSEIV